MKKHSLAALKRTHYCESIIDSTSREEGLTHVDTFSLKPSFTNQDFCSFHHLPETSFPSSDPHHVEWQNDCSGNHHNKIQRGISPFCTTVPCASLDTNNDALQACHLRAYA